MTTFDLAEVRQFAVGLDARMDRCDNGEGLECANLDETLGFYAALCCEFYDNVRQWGRAVFNRKVAFDPEVEKLWLDEGIELYHRSRELWEYGQGMSGKCFMLEQGSALGSALWRLDQLLKNWVSPKPAVAPLARHGMALTSAAKEEAQKRIDALAPLPADWQPTDSRRLPMFRKLRGMRNP